MFTVEEYNPILDKIRDLVENLTPEQLPEHVHLDEGIPKWDDDRIWVPEELQTEALKDVHQSMIAAVHQGIKTTY